MANEVLCVFRDRCDVPSHREPSGGNRQATPGPAIDHVVFAGCDRCQLLVFVMNEYEEKTAVISIPAASQCVKFLYQLHGVFLLYG
jgi:hypothetical protein